MSNLHKNKVKKLIHSIGLKHNLSDEVIKKIVNSPYLFAFQKIKELELDDIKTEEELDNIKTNFYFKNLCKLYLPFDRLDRNHKQRDNLKNINNKKWKK